MQAISKKALKGGMIAPSGLPIEIKTKQTRKTIDQVRIVPRLDGYMVEVVYQKKEEDTAVDPELVAALDLGVNVLAAVTSTKAGFQPLLVNGRPLKHLNQYYNKQRAHHQSHLARAKHFHFAPTRSVYDEAYSPHQRLFAYGKPSDYRSVDERRNWDASDRGKTRCGSKRLRSANAIIKRFADPSCRFIEMLTYKAKLVGIHVVMTRRKLSQQSLVSGS